MVDSDTLRILVATDCHLGYMEKDEVRRHDSFNAFDEICAIASQRQVDFLLLGGDLFHENKPSRSTLVRTIEILRRYCLNDRPVQFQVVSDQTINFPNKFGHVNYEDPHFNVGLPVFTIHGNHDDPAGVDHLSAIDILAACNLVNYFGKAVLGGNGVGQISMYPVLLQKGSTKVALYGLGNIRDERLNRMFQTPHAVQWIRPESLEGCPTSEWFNIFVLHQNRVKTNPKNAINEHFLARFLDFVIWGHEHECLIDPQEVLGMDFHVTQPGSSVATSLVAGEAKPKHVLLLEIKGNQYRPTKIPLGSVRPFEFMDVSLKDQPDLDPNDQTAVLEYLGKVVNDLISKAAENEAGHQEAMVPLIRVRVDYTGFTTINPQRFGQKFVGKVANPHDILLFTKAAKKRASTDGPIDEKEKLRPEELNQQNIEALVAESNLKMEILPVTDLGMALHDFVNKDDKQAFYACVHQNLDVTQNKLTEEADLRQIQEESDVVVKVGEHMQVSFSFLLLTSAVQTVGGRSGGKSIQQIETFSDDEVVGQREATPKAATAAKQKQPARQETKDEPNSSRGRGKGTRGRGRGSRGNLTQTTLDVLREPRPSRRAASAAATVALQRISESEEDEPASLAASDKDSDEELGEPESDPEPVVSTKDRKRPAPTSQRRGRGVTAKRGRGSSSVARTGFIDDDDVEDDDNDVVPAKSSGTPTSQRHRSWGSLRG
ncbi:unnamed protein product [Sphagnum jensenii]|uniref:Double-strand break repair protein n=2 Tax=Sphagnum jensenii TaxID=128206 RepID=A0ABP1A3Y4_9BRYO